MNLFKVALTFIVAFSTQVHSAWFGTYDYTTSAMIDPNTSKHVYFWGQESFFSGNIFLCVDATPRRVPGKVTGTTCNVEWKGKEHKNSVFGVLINEGYSWQTLTTSNKDFIMHYGVTPGVIDEGNYVYHCKITVLGNVTAGKYIPSRNGCYFGLSGGRFYGINSEATLEILVKIH